MSPTLLHATPEPVELGTLRPGETARATLTLRNPLPDPISVVRIETTCPCVATTPVPLRIEPGETAGLSLVFDSSKEPEFRGNLQVEIVGFGTGGEIAFRSRLLVGIAGELREERR